MAKTKLSVAELRILEALGDLDQKTGEALYQHNFWSPYLGDDWEENKRVLSTLKRRGLVASEGRGKAAQFWITVKGAEARGAQN